jgi:hypothetical protein
VINSTLFESSKSLFTSDEYKFEKLSANQLLEKVNISDYAHFAQLPARSEGDPLIVSTVQNKEGKQRKSQRFSLKKLLGKSFSWSSKSRTASKLFIQSQKSYSLPPPPSSQALLTSPLYPTTPASIVSPLSKISAITPNNSILPAFPPFPPPKPRQHHQQHPRILSLPVETCGLGMRPPPC